MPAYIVFTRLRTRNPDEVKLYAEQAPKSLAGHTMKFLAQFGRFEVREGGGVEGVAILEFRSFAEAGFGGSQVRLGACVTNAPSEYDGAELYER